MRQVCPLLVAVLFLGAVIEVLATRELTEKPICSPVWGQCGGKGWKGPTCCQAGNLCKVQVNHGVINEYYSQCLPDSRSPAGCSNWWGQCGGKEWKGPTCCEPGSTCQIQINNGVKNEFYSQCLPDSKEGVCSFSWGQCGGKDWHGPRCCQAGSVCTDKSQNGANTYLQCVPTSPTNTVCPADEQGPTVTSFSPESGSPGTMLTVYGSNFSPLHYKNSVRVGDRPAIVVAATATELKVIAEPTVSGPIQVTVAGRTGTGTSDFRVRGHPSESDGEDGPPISFEGSEPAAGAGDPGAEANPYRILVILQTPTDRTPPEDERAKVVAKWEDVKTFYKQASYGKKILEVDFMEEWATLDGPLFPDYYDKTKDNFKNTRSIAAQGVKAAMDASFDINGYAMFAFVCFVSPESPRALGNLYRQDWQYVSKDMKVNIDIKTANPVFYMLAGSRSSWGRFAHETGHNLVSTPEMPKGSALREDVYGSDLVDGAQATAAQFEMMGNHEVYPLFSGYYMENLQFYNDDNIKVVPWSRDAFSQEFDVVAHGLEEDATERVHLVKITVSAGLWFYVEVRQRPGDTEQIFDPRIPLAASGDGGVIVTRVISGVLSINQQTRFITLLHDAERRTLGKDEFAVDPARAIRITVVDDAVQLRPLVCRVRVEWATAVASDPKGSFDVFINPWDGNFQTPDIWVDRDIDGKYDNPLDSEGRPLGNGDRPEDGKKNALNARIHVSGVAGAADVKVTYYAIFPPGIGDSGNWAPIGERTIAAIPANDHVDVAVNWIPVVKEHTCLKVYATAQAGEVSADNNMAQENVFDFYSEASSPPVPVMIRVAVRNPRNVRTLVHLNIARVPLRWRVHFPHSFVWLEANGEKHFDLIVIPLFDWHDIVGCASNPDYFTGPKPSATASVTIEGSVDHVYNELLPPLFLPSASRRLPIGGILSNVHVRKQTYIFIQEGLNVSLPQDTTIVVEGALGEKLADQRVRVECKYPTGRRRVLEARTDGEGTFQVTFDLRLLSGTDASQEFRKSSELVDRGTYIMQAILFNAGLVADATSNLLNVYRLGLPMPLPPVVIK